MNRVLRAQTAIVMAGIISSLSYSAIWSQAGLESAGSFLVSDVNPDAPSEEIQRKASAGHLPEELELARDYYIGRGVSRDLSLAAYWYRRAADQGDPGAQVDIVFPISLPQRNWCEAGRGAKRGKVVSASGCVRVSGGQAQPRRLVFERYGSSTGPASSVNAADRLANMRMPAEKPIWDICTCSESERSATLVMRSIGLKRRRTTIVPKVSMRWVRSFR